MGWGGGGEGLCGILVFESNGGCVYVGQGGYFKYILRGGGARLVF